MFYVYVLESVINKRHYTGQIFDIDNRLKEQNSFKVKSTKDLAPWKLVYLEEFETREEAIKREKYLKSGYGRMFLKKKLGSEG